MPNNVHEPKEANFERQKIKKKKQRDTSAYMFKVYFSYIVCGNYRIFLCVRECIAKSFYLF